MFNSHIICILYLDVNRFDFYINGSETVLHFDFSPVATNLEITNHEELTTQIKAFIDANKIPFSNIVIILSEPIVFVKALAPNQDHEQELQRFVTNIPFEHVSQRIYPIENGALIVAANRDFYGAFQNAFEKNGFTCDLVVPIFTSGVTTVNPQVGLDAESAKRLVAFYENLRQNNLENKTNMKSSVTHIPTPTPVTKKAQKGNNKRVFLLAGIFGALIVILAVILLTSNSTPATQKNILPTPQAMNTNKPNSVVLGEHTAHLSQKTIQIVIQFHENNSSQAALLKKIFINEGFENITTIQKIDSPSYSASQSIHPLVLFSPSISDSLQGKIEKLVQFLSAPVATAQVDSLSVDALISLEK